MMRTTKAKARGAAPAWPRNGNPRRWLLCCAAWGLLVDPRSEAGHYLHVALGELARGGHRADVDRIVRRLLAVSAKDLVRSVRDQRAIANAYLWLNDENNALGHLEALVSLAEAQPKASDRELLLATVREFRTRKGLLDDDELRALDPTARVIAECHRAERARLAGDRKKAKACVDTAASFLSARTGGVDVVFHLYMSLGETKAARRLWDGLSAARRAELDISDPASVIATGLRSAALARFEKEGKSALSQLSPGAWNIHLPAGMLESAVEDLVAIGERAKADALLSAAIERIGNKLNDRGFASGAAYASLAKASFVLRGRDAALPLLRKAIGVSGRDRQMLLPAVIEVYASMDLFDDALALAAKVGREGRAVITAEVLFAAKRWKELGAVLEAIDSPEIAVKTAWSFFLSSRRRVVEAKRRTRPS